MQIAWNERSFKVTNPLEEEKTETKESTQKEGTSGRTKSAAGNTADKEKITIPGATYEVPERYYDLTRYVNDVNTDNTQVLQEYTQSGNLKSSHIYGNERIYSDIYDPVTEAFNVSNYNYDGRGSVVQTVTGTDVTSQLSYDPFGNLTSGGRRFQATTALTQRIQAGLQGCNTLGQDTMT